MRGPRDEASWAEFHRLYRQLIYGRARRAGLAHEDAEDVTQEVFKRVAETIQTFDPDPQRGSFRGWLMQLTQWRIADQFERRARSPGYVVSTPDGGETYGAASSLERVPAPDDESEVWDREWQRHVLAVALERLARAVRPRHFQVFDLYVRQQWPVLRVAGELDVNPAAVYVISHRLTKRLRAEIEHVRETLG